MEKDITIDGQHLHYEVTGNGPALLLMHGWGCSLTTVRSIAQTAARTHTVYNLDLPGFGSSAEPPETWGVEEYSHLVEEFMKAENIERPVLAGHSFGGRLAIYLSARGRIRPDSIILIDAAGIKPRRSFNYYRKVYAFKLLKKIAPVILGSEKGERLIRSVREKRGSSDYSQASPVMRAVLSRTVNQDLTPLLKDIDVPALLIWGENDTATPMRDARLMEKIIPDCGLVSFPGCGHYSFLDNPVQFAAVLQSFLSSRKK
ncbi:MAG: alpha/beta hydrolase [Bacteroidales bacterium]|nr:alpha/beta hydrolase [Bacteroidales bacterium]